MTKGERVFLGAFGSFLLGLGVFALGQDHLSLLWRLGGSFVLVMLGGNSLLSAIGGKSSWLSRLGPLP
jgi:hypothetical protein